MPGTNRQTGGEPGWVRKAIAHGNRIPATDLEASICAEAEELPGLLAGDGRSRKKLRRALVALEIKCMRHLGLRLDREPEIAEVLSVVKDSELRVALAAEVGGMAATLHNGSKTERDAKLSAVQELCRRLIIVLAAALLVCSVCPACQDFPGQEHESCQEISPQEISLAG